MFVTCLRSSRISFSSRPRLRSGNPTIRNSGIPPNWPQPNENSKLQAIVNFFVLKNMFCRFWIFLSPSLRLRSNVFTVLDSESHNSICPRIRPGSSLSQIFGPRSNIFSIASISLLAFATQGWRLLYTFGEFHHVFFWPLAQSLTPIEQWIQAGCKLCC